jgi:chaperonin cofactor prefoldin
MVSRIKQLISHMGLSTRAFALKCDLRQNTFSNQLNGMRELSLSTVTAILNTYPEVSSEWLMRGSGEMFISKEVDQVSEKLMKMVDTISLMQDTINTKSDTIIKLTERVKQLENQITK